MAKHTVHYRREVKVEDLRGSADMHVGQLTDLTKVPVSLSFGVERGGEIVAKGLLLVYADDIVEGLSIDFDFDDVEIVVREYCVGKQVRPYQTAVTKDTTLYLPLAGPVAELKARLLKEKLRLKREVSRK